MVLGAGGVGSLDRTSILGVDRDSGGDVGLAPLTNAALDGVADSDSIMVMGTRLLTPGAISNRFGLP